MGYFKRRREERARLKKERRERKRQKKQCPLIANLEKEFQGANADVVIDLLCDEFYLGGTTIQFASGKKVCIDQLKKYVKNSTFAAESISPIMFWGGCPGQFAYYQGSLLTVLYDVILRRWSTTGAYADLVGQEKC